MYSNIDYLIVGAGIYGVTIARLLTDVGYKCLIIDKDDHIGGKCYSIPGDQNLYDIHLYGPHVFHTSDMQVAQFITNYTKFVSYKHKVIANNNGNYYDLPFNMNTFYALFKTASPEEAYDKINEEIEEAKNIYKDRDDLEATANKLVGKTIYNALIKEYTEKQWNKECSKLPGDIIKRLPLRFDYDSHYFNDIFYGIPTNGYNVMFENIINGNAFDQNIHLPILYMLNYNFNYNEWRGRCKNIIYCGAVDELLNYKLGELEWRSLRFEHTTYEYNGHNGQGTPVINYINSDVEATRSTEHMYFTKERWNGKTNFKSVITTEYPDNYEKGKERYYPVVSYSNIDLYNRYVELLNKVMPEVMLGGRLGKYKYFDMDRAIKEAINDAATIITKDKNISENE